MATNGVIPSASSTSLAWRSALDDPYPTPVRDERVLLSSHVSRGFSLPPSAFLIEIFDHYGLQLHNITPNSLLYISGFVALFEGYLGIKPRLDFFQRCFLVKRQTVNKELLVAGSISFNCRRDIDWYPQVPIVDSAKGWASTFFYCKDVAPPNRLEGLAPFTDRKSVV